MMTVAFTVGPSKIHGKGLFAAEHILAGTVVWRFNSSTDEEYTKEEAEALPEPKRSLVLSLVHSYISASSGKYILNNDDAKYFNHSFESNVVDSDEEECCIAVRDIAIGEELTIDYRKFPEENPLNFEVAL